VRKFSLIALLTVALVFCPCKNLYSQSLPEKLQDLPPELKVGLPYNMNYDEYKTMKKRLTLPKIFLAAMIPGYAHYYADRKLEAGIIFGIRAIGYGLMGTGFYLQMNNIEDLFNIESLPESSLNRLKTNLYIFMGGLVLNAAGFFYDWAGAESAIESDRGKVLYKYGLFKKYGGYNENALIAYIRKLIIQDNAQLKKSLIDSLSTYTSLYPFGKYADEVEYYLGNFYSRTNQTDKALLHFVKQIYLFPQSRLTPVSKRRIIELATENRTPWSNDIYTILNIATYTPKNLKSNEANYLLFIENWNKLTNPSFIKLGISEMKAYLKLFPSSGRNDTILFTIARQSEQTRNYTLSLESYLSIIKLYPKSKYIRQALLKSAIIFKKIFRDENRAKLYYQELINNYPNSEEAEKAKADISK